MGSMSWLGFINHQQSHLSHTLVSPKEEPTSCHGPSREGEPRAARQSEEQAAFLAVAFRMKQLRRSLLSPSEAKSPVHVTLNTPKPGESRGGGAAGRVWKWELHQLQGIFPRKQKAQVPSALCRRKHSPFPQILGPSRRAVSSGMGACHTRLVVSPVGQLSVGQGPGGPPAHPQGLVGKKPFCTLMCALLRCKNAGSPMAWLWPFPRVT